MKDVPSKCMCGLIVIREISSASLNDVLNFLIESAGMTNGGSTGDIPLVPKINSRKGLLGGVGAKNILNVV